MTDYGLTLGPAPEQRTKLIQAWLRDNDVAGYVMIRTDEFQGEYLPPYAERLHWLTGFSGSAGVVVVGQEKSAIFVDGRYTVQVKDEINYDLYTVQHLINEPATDWVESNFKQGDVIAYDPWLFTPSSLAVFKKSADKIGAFLQEFENPIDLIWDEQPSAPVGAVVVHPMEYAGVSHAQKLEKIAVSLIENDLDSCLLTMSCSLAWLFNIRGSDVPFNPVMLGYAIVHNNATAEIYADKNKFSAEVLSHLGDNVIVKDFSEVAVGFSDLAGIVGADFTFTPQGLINIVRDGGAEVIHFADQARYAKAFKNDVEQQGMRNCHIRDGAVMARMLHWVDTTPVSEQSEWKNAQKLEEFRRQADGFKDFSFDTISGFGGNGAICHYRVNAQTEKKFSNDNLFLLDSGSQYDDGTTDITRTMPIGTASEEHVHNYTLVLKGLIALTRAKFPSHYTAEQLDCIARAPLFNEGKNFDHGTGHGVGAALNVHEGPFYFSHRGRGVSFGVGAILSNEPGYYVADNYGIRIENLMIAQDAGNDWLEWETITFCPIDTRLINVALLDTAERQWLNDYHAETYAKISPLLQGDESVLEWLKIRCKSV